MKTYEVSWLPDDAPGNEPEHETFYTLNEAKAFMKSHTGSVGYIYKTWSNGDFECMGRIALKGSNKTFVANSKQRVANY